jgi:hypothetical protein
MSEWTVYAEAGEPAEQDGPRDAAEIDDSLEVRRLSRWLKAMFGGAKDSPPDVEPSDADR